MELMGRGRFLTWAVLAVTLLVGGCAATSPSIPAGFTPNEQEAIVFGRMEFIVNGTTLPPDTRFGMLKPNIGVHISSLTDATTLDRSEWSAGQFYLTAPVSENGMFIAKLPVGRYYVETLSYFGTRQGHGNFTSWRTYDTRSSKPILLTFDVVPNKATYLGTVRNLVTLGALSLSSQEYSFDLAFADERTDADGYLLQRHPGMRESIESRPMRVQAIQPGE